MLSVDLAVYNEKRELVLTVEVKNLRDVSDEWASQLRKNIVSTGNYPSTKYFLLSTPDRFFLWIGKSNDLRATKPDYEAEMTDALRPLYKEFRTSPDKASSFIFEEIVTRWLKDIMYPGYNNSNHSMPEWLIESELDKAIFQGDFYIEQAA